MKMMMLQNIQIRDGEYTKTIYTLIKEQRYSEAVQILNHILDAYPNSRAALSLLAYCYFYMQDFVNAANCYEHLTMLFPEIEDYRLYYAQSLYQACLYEESMKVTHQIEGADYAGRITKLQAAIKYGEEDLPGAKSLVDQCPADDPDTEVNHGCLLYKEGRFEEACQKFTSALQVAGNQPHLSYNIALCHYRLKQYAPALKHIADIIERGIREHPELSVGMTTEGIEVRSVGNTLTLHETALIEAFNLKAAIEYQLKNCESAMGGLPPKLEYPIIFSSVLFSIFEMLVHQLHLNLVAVRKTQGTEAWSLDAVTLHNQALMNMDTKPTDGFEKMQFLLGQNPFPPETFGNLLLLYCKYEYYHLAADVLAENAHLTYKYLTPHLFDFLDALITQQTSPSEAYRKFDELGSRHIELLRKLTKVVQEARQNHDDDQVKNAVNEYEEVLERYIPVLMAQAKIYWDLENYSQVEKIFRKSVEFCNESDVWKLNVAHVLFMQENKFKEATGFYEPIVKKNYDNILNVSAIVLANLCVSYIMTSQNEEAEELMRKIEKEEEQLAYEDPDKKIYHLCIVNLVIGYYAKRCFLSLIENLAKHMITVKDSVIQECIQFLEHCEVYGRNVKTLIEQPLEEMAMHPGKNTVTYESRLAKALLLQIQQM
nr:tetratricopeptide repeat protein 30A-like [Penaeus vannamei]